MKITLERYGDLQDYVGYFLQGVYEIMIIEGAPGIGKSSVVKHAFSHLDPTTDFLWLEGRTSAAAFYKALYQFVDCPIVLDDTDDFLQDRQSINLLKTLCQTDTTKRVSWLTTRMPHDLPAHFFTSSTVILLTNETKKHNIHLRSIQDRGLHILFKPTKQEIHQYAQKLCSTEVYSFIDLFLPSIEELTLRLYVKAQNALDAGIPWRTTLVKSWDLDPLLRVFLEIELEYPDKTQNDKQDLFLKVTGKTSKTYDRVRSQLRTTRPYTPFLLTTGLQKGVPGTSQTGSLPGTSQTGTQTGPQTPQKGKRVT